MKKTSMPQAEYDPAQWETKAQEISDTAWREIILNGQLLADAGLHFEIRGDNVVITDARKPLNLFQSEAIQELVLQFGEQRADQLLNDAGEMIDAEMFARVMRNAKLNSK